MELNSGWLMTVMRQRGMPTGQDGDIRKAINGLRENQRTAIREAARKVEIGADDATCMAILGCVTACVGKQAEECFSKLGIAPSKDAVFDWMTREPTYLKVLRDANVGDRAAVASVMEELGKASMQDRPAPVKAAPAAKRVVGRVAAQEQQKRRGGYGGRLLEAGSVGQAGPKATGELEEKAEEAQQPDASRVAKIYRQSGGLTIEMDVVRKGKGHRENTVRVEAAERVGPRTYDWDGKIIIQLGIKELPVFAGFVLGARKRCSFDFHGDGNDKALEGEVQPGNLYIKVRQGSRTIAVPIDEGDLYEASIIVLRALFLNDPDMEQSTIIGAVMRSAAVSNAKEESRKSGHEERQGTRR